MATIWGKMQLDEILEYADRYFSEKMKLKIKNELKLFYDWVGTKRSPETEEYILSCVRDIAMERVETRKFEISKMEYLDFISQNPSDEELLRFFCLSLKNIKEFEEKINVTLRQKRHARNEGILQNNSQFHHYLNNLDKLKGNKYEALKKLNVLPQSKLGNEMSYSCYCKFLKWFRFERCEEEL